jgi:hypothetical protein
MLDFDRSLTWKTIQEKLDKITNPRHRKMLEEVVAHAKGEVDGDLDAVLSTLSRSPVYRYMGNDSGRIDDPQGTEGIRKWYTEWVFGGGRSFVEVRNHRVVVDDDTVVTEATQRMLQWGRDLVAQGTTVDDPDATYLRTGRHVIVWPFDAEGKAIGEELWAQPMTRTIEKVAEEDVPAEFRAYIESKLSLTK